MCAGIEYRGRRILWTDPQPMLPVVLNDGDVAWGPWGRPYHQNTVACPAGGWARLDSIYAGKWKRYHPHPVKIPADAFMERDANGEPVWFTVGAGRFIQGLAIEVENLVMRRERGDSTVHVYMVTVPAAANVSQVHDRMPRIITL